MTPPELSDILLRMPNVNHDSVPVGKGPEDNRVERVVGTPVELKFKPKPHWEIGTQLGLIDLEAATKISGSGFIVFKGKGARLERALINYLLDLHTTQHGYTEVSTPYLVRGESMQGTSQLPKFAEDMYRVNEEPPLYLVPTAEVPVTNLHREEIVSAEKLPIRYAAYTPCFRREAGKRKDKETRAGIDPGAPIRQGGIGPHRHPRKNPTRRWKSWSAMRNGCFKRSGAALPHRRFRLYRRRYWLWRREVLRSRSLGSRRGSLAGSFFLQQLRGLSGAPHEFTLQEQRRKKYFLPYP